MTWTNFAIDTAGYAAAGTLGYIENNIKGANRRIKDYRNYRTMAPLRTPKSLSSRHKPYRSSTPARRHSISGTPVYSAKSVSSRRSSTASSMSGISRASTAISRKSNYAEGSRGSNFTVGAKGKKRVKALHKRVKRVKVTRKLRAKINKVLEGKDPHGFYQAIGYSNIKEPGSHAQSVGLISVQGTVDGVDGTWFSPTQVNHAASILWNNKTPIPSIGFADPGNFNWNNIRINVIKQWGTIKFRNNAQRNMNVNLYTCVRKTNGQSTSASAEWNNGLSQDVTSNVNVAGQTGFVTPTTLYATPAMSKSFGKNWDVETTKIYIKPGEEYVHTFQGPSKMYDYRKFWSGSVNWNYPKGTVAMMYTAHMDLLAGSTSGVDRAGQLTLAANIGQKLLYETNYYCKIEVPLQAGITWKAGATAIEGPQPLPVAGQTTELGNKRDAYCVDILTNVITGNYVRNEIEIPTTAQINPS